jgi:hypothetical protein
MEVGELVEQLKRGNMELVRKIIGFKEMQQEMSFFNYLTLQAEEQISE